MSSEGMRTASANPAATAPSPDPSTTPIRGRRLARSRMNCAACSARRKSSVAEVAIGFDHPAGSDCHPERSASPPWRAPPESEDPLIFKKSKFGALDRNECEIAWRAKGSFDSSLHSSLRMTLQKVTFAHE